MNETEDSTLAPRSTYVTEEMVKALVAFQGELKAAVKSGVNPHFKSTFSTLEDVWNAVREPLSKNSLAVNQGLHWHPGPANWVLLTTLRHPTGGSISSWTPLLGATTPQAMGSSLSYAKRYALMALLGVPSEDDDANAAQKEKEATRKPPAPKEKEATRKPPAPTAQKSSAEAKGGALNSPSAGRPTTREFTRMGKPIDASQADWKKKAASPKQVGMLKGMWEKLDRDTLGLPEWKEFLGKNFGKSSAKELTGGEASQLIEYFKPLVPAVGSDADIAAAASEGSHA